MSTNIKKYRLAKNLSLRQLARELDIDHSTLSYWESGARTPRTDNAIKLASYFNTTVEELMNKPIK